MKFYSEKDLGMCGLACVLCREEECIGCKVRGCKNGCDCSAYQCANEKSLDGCYECEKFPCEERMLQGTRNRAFNQYARNYGKQALLDRLKINFENGINYHSPDGGTSHYDSLATEEDIMRLIRFGTHTPYINCPTLETDIFIYRLVEKNDADDLIKCYSDSKSQELFNSINCSTNFSFNTLDELRKYIDYWLLDYSQQAYVRFAIMDKSTKVVVGTIEMFGMIGQYKVERGILRLDLISTYENKAALDEIINMCVENFYLLFDVKEIATRAVPQAAIRIETLLKHNFKYCDLNDRELNYIRSK